MGEAPSISRAWIGVIIFLGGILFQRKREIWPLYSVGKDGERKGIVYVLEKPQWNENYLMNYINIFKLGFDDILFEWIQ